jgi:hypothetical protein
MVIQTGAPAAPSYSGLSDRHRHIALTRREQARGSRLYGRIWARTELAPGSGSLLDKDERGFNLSETRSRPYSLIQGPILIGIS